MRRPRSKLLFELMEQLPRILAGFGCAFGSFLLVAMLIVGIYQLSVKLFIFPTFSIKSAEILVVTRPIVQTESVVPTVSAEPTILIPTLIPPEPTAPRFTGQPLGGGTGLLAYVSNESGNFDIYTMQIDGTDKKQLTKTTANEWFPNWSADGKRILFHTFRDGNSELYWIDQDGSNPINLTNSPSEDSFGDNSADGQWIVFQSDRTGNNDLYLMRSDGSDLRNLTNSPTNESYPSFAPDGNRVAFSRELKPGDTELFIMQIDGSADVQITRSNGNNFAPSWSADGTTIVYHTDRDGSAEIYRISADGTNETRLTNNQQDDFFPSYSPDGKWILFHTTLSQAEDSNRNLMLISADLLLEQTLTNQETQERMPKLQP